MTWRDRLRPASYRGAEFKVDTAARAGGRRGVNFEYPKRNTPSDEDMGRRAHRFAVSGYVIGPDYTIDADLLEDALNADGPGLLILSTMGEMQVRCETYTRSENKDRGGFTAFDMTFVEAGTAADELVIESTQAALRSEADTASSALADNGNEQVVAP